MKDSTVIVAILSCVLVVVSVGNVLSAFVGDVSQPNTTSVEAVKDRVGETVLENACVEPENVCKDQVVVFDDSRQINFVDVFDAGFCVN